MPGGRVFFVGLDCCEVVIVGGVRIPVIGVVAPAMADDDHLASDG